ncbi:hypothetical protein BDV23DRAFT_181502 [Aspergillus alliaceus]|uniref:Uncharacterized protein n=1 Tax=Petromyces alliaceus TaxID=209559 RepID=A0A5N7CGD1_PETAA|nr:hypothetical protein BDV23DRAFT_181502 [Aspergillus alliaceus]
MYTREERMERLSARIQGEGLLSQSGPKRCLGERLLFGVILHAAARSSQGKALSPLEARLLSTLRMFCDNDEQEIAHYGSCYERQKMQARASRERAAFPACILDLDNDAPYTSERLKQDVRDLAPEIGSEPSNQVIDMSRVPIGLPVDSREYLDHLRAADGYGVTVFTAPASSSSSTGRRRNKQNESPPKLRTKGFTPLKYPASRSSPMYWAMASGSHSEIPMTEVTDKIEGVRQETRFNLDNVLFEGDSDGPVLGHIQCWQENEGDSNWFTELGNTLQQISDLCVTTAQEAMTIIGDHGELDAAPVVVMLGANVNNLISELRDSSAKADGLIGKRTFGWTREGLDYFKEMDDQTTRMEFEYEDYYLVELEIQRVYEELLPPPPVGGVLIYCSDDGESWSEPVGVEGSRAQHSMAMAECLGTLYGVYSDIDRQLWITSMGSDGSWQQPTPMPGNQTESPLAMAAASDDKMLIIYRGLDDRLSYLLSDFRKENPLESWDKQTGRNILTTRGVRLCPNKRGSLVPIGTTRFLSAFNASVIAIGSEDGFIPLPQTAGRENDFSIPDVFMWDDRLHVAVSTIYNSLRLYAWSSRWLYFEDAGSVPFEFVQSISCASFAGALCVAYRKPDHSVWLAKFTTERTRSDHETGITARADPRIYVFNGKLYLSLPGVESED